MGQMFCGHRQVVQLREAGRRKYEMTSDFFSQNQKFLGYITLTEQKMIICCAFTMVKYSRCTLSAVQ